MTHKKHRGRSVSDLIMRSCFSSSSIIVALAVALLLSASLAACGDEPPPSRSASGSRSKIPEDEESAGGGGDATKASTAEVTKTQDTTAPGNRVLPAKEREIPEAAFIETDENRDPFRGFMHVFVAQALPVEEELGPRPPVLLEDVSIDEMRLIAIVSGEGGNPRAMIVDTEGMGHIVGRGDYVGRGERIRLGPGQPEREIKWRVLTVRPDRIVLVREDPIQAGPPVTRVLRLYPEDES